MPGDVNVYGFENFNMNPFLNAKAYKDMRLEPLKWQWSNCVCFMRIVGKREMFRQSQVCQLQLR